MDVNHKKLRIVQTPIVNFSKAQKKLETKSMESSEAPNNQTNANIMTKNQMLSFLFQAIL